LTGVRKISSPVKLKIPFIVDVFLIGRWHSLIRWVLSARTVPVIIPSQMLKVDGCGWHLALPYNEARQLQKNL
jgi:hypothetical protein